MKVQYVSASADHTKPVEVRTYRNATLTGASFSAVSSGKSPVYKDTSATAFSGGTLARSIPLGKTGQSTLDMSLDVHGGLIQPGDMLTFTIAPKSGNSAEATVAVIFEETI